MISSIEWTEQKQAAVAIISLFAAINLYPYFRYYGNQPEAFYVKYSFPHAQLWYEAMTLKYPIAHLDKKRFLQTMPGVAKEQTPWSASCNNIYCPQGDLIYLEAAYKKQIEGELLSDDEIKNLDTMEWLLLHEAGHIELNYSFHEITLVIGTVAALEIMKMLYKESTDDACKKSIESILDTYSIKDETKKSLVSKVMWMRYIFMTISELLLSGWGKVFWIRDQEAQADSFANKHAATDALPGAINFFQRFIDYYQNIVEDRKNEFEQNAYLVWLLSYFNRTPADFARQITYFQFDPVHPSFDYRIQQIHNEIENRLKNQIVA